MDNSYFDKKTRRRSPCAARSSCRPDGNPLENIFIREIGTAEANRLLASHGERAGFTSVFNGKDFSGWSGRSRIISFGRPIMCLPKKGGTIYTKDEFSDFTVRLEFKSARGNNASPSATREGDTATSACAKARSSTTIRESHGKPIDPRQAHGSVYGMIAGAARYQHPIGEWNFEEVTVRGSTSSGTQRTVILNATYRSHRVHGQLASSWKRPDHRHFGLRAQRSRRVSRDSDRGL